MWRRRSKSKESDATRRAREAAERAGDERKRVEKKWAEVEKIAHGLNTALERNHFGESIELALRRKAAP